jgi:hypothetical protein
MHSEWRLWAYYTRFLAVNDNMGLFGLGPLPADVSPCRFIQTQSNSKLETNSATGCVLLVMR